MYDVWIWSIAGFASGSAFGYIVRLLQHPNHW